MLKSFIKKIIPSSLLSFYHFFLALAGAFLYNFPSRKMIVIGVTGTKGKSTTAILAGKILEKSGYPVSWFTSATIKIGNKEQLNPYHMTMPGRFAIQRFLKMALKEGCKYAIVEVTSEGIKQHRHKFIKFDTAVFTNLKPEHIEAHGSFEKYRYCKGKLFEATKNIHILNIDDENVDYFLRFPAKKKLTFGLERGDVNTKNVRLKLQLIGDFNFYNSLAAICIGLSQGISLEVCEKALTEIKGIPGRMEIIVNEPFKVIVDLAHTPESYEEVFKTVKAIPHHKIISVFGSAGGGRDKWKRPILGKIAGENSDIVILTNEDPYDENPLLILEDIERGFSQIPKSKLQTTKYEKILDRRQAIKKALELADENDIVMILGKGTEQLMMVGNKKIPWDDRKIVWEELFKLNNKKKKYEILEHKADLKIRIFGTTKEILFVNALFAMQECLNPELTSDIDYQSFNREIKIKSIDLPVLLVDFLSEALYLIQINKEIYERINFKKLTETELEAELWGRQVEKFGDDIKAVTYHNLEVKQKEDKGWEAVILFDI